MSNLPIISCFKCIHWNCLSKDCVHQKCQFTEHINDHGDLIITPSELIDENISKKMEENEMINTNINGGLITSGNKPNEDYARKIIAVGEALIKNAESIAGCEENLRQIYFDVSIEREEKTELNIHKSINVIPKVD